MPKGKKAAADAMDRAMNKAKQKAETDMALQNAALSTGQAPPKWVHVLPFILAVRPAVKIS